MPAAPRSDVSPIASMILSWRPRPLRGGTASPRRRTRDSEVSMRAAAPGNRDREGVSTISAVGMAVLIWGLEAGGPAAIFGWEAGAAAFTWGFDAGDLSAVAPPGAEAEAAGIFG